MSTQHTTEHNHTTALYTAKFFVGCVVVLFALMLFGAQNAEAAVSHSASSESHTGLSDGSASQSSFSWTHDEAGSPEGVIVFVTTAANADYISTVTYGGTTMTEVGESCRTGTYDNGCTTAFFLGSSIPTGNRTVVVNRTNNATVMYAVAATVNADFDTEVFGVTSYSGYTQIAEQSIDDGSTGTNSLRYAGAWSGEGTVFSGTNSTRHEVLGTLAGTGIGAALASETTAGQGSRDVGFSDGAFWDHAGVYLAIREKLPSVTHSVDSESHTGTTGSTFESSFSWSHGDSDSPEGVLVFVTTLADADYISSVTYGGQTMTQVAEARDTAGSPGRMTAFFLGSGVPSGSQTVVVNRTSNGTTMYATAITVNTVIPGQPTRVVGTKLFEEDGGFIEQTVDDGSNGTRSLRYASAYSSYSTLMASGNNSQIEGFIDFGAQTTALARGLTPKEGSEPIGFSLAGTWNRAAIHLAVQEIATTTPYETSGSYIYTVPPNIYSLAIKAWGGGGGGGAGGTVSVGGYGGGGGFASGTIAVTPGQEIGITVGSGGGLGTWSGATNLSGEGGGGGGYSIATSSSGTLILAAGGGGGGGGDNGTGAAAGGAGGAGGGTTGVTGGASDLALGGGGGTSSSGGSGGTGGVQAGTSGSSLNGGDGGSDTGITGGAANGGIPGGGDGAIVNCAGCAGGGGGGSGYYGGGGGSSFVSGQDGGGGGGGGSSYTTPSAIGVELISGSGRNAGNNTDGDYAGTAGYGGNRGSTSGDGADGNSGLVVITALEGEPPTISFSGTLYSNEGITPITSSKTIKVAVGTSTPSVHSTTTDGSGNWTLDVDSTNLFLSMPVVVWVDGDSVKASHFTKASSTSNNIPNLDLYQSRVIISHEGTSGTSTTNSDLSFYDGSDDTDIQYTVGTLAQGFPLSVRAGNELHIKTGKTFAPGGAVTINGNAGSGADGSFHLPAGAVYTAGGTTTIAGNFTASSTASFTPGSYTLVFNATTTGKSIDTIRTSEGGIATLGDVTFNGSGGAWSFAQANATTTDLTITNGTLTAPSGILTVTGNYTQNGSFTDNGGTVHFFTDASQTIAGTMTTSATDFNHIVFTGGDATDNKTFSSNASTTDFTINSGATVVAPANSSISGNFTQNGNFTTNAATINFNGSSAQSLGGDMVGAEDDFYSIIFSGAGTKTFTGDADLFYLTIESGSSLVAPSGILSLYGDYTNNGLFEHNNGTLEFKSAVSRTLSGTMNTPETDFYNLIFSNVGTKTFSNNASTSGDFTIQSGAPVVAPASLSIAGDYTNNGTFTHSSGEVIFGGTPPFEYLAGRDTKGDDVGTGDASVNAVTAQDEYLYIVKTSNATACSQSAGSAIGCEIMVFDATDPTNPTYVAGRDVTGNSTGSGSLSVTAVAVLGNYLYVGTGGNATACSQTAGSAIGCEILVFDVSDPSNPTYVAGRDVSANAAGTGNLDIQSLTVFGNYLYVGTVADTTACSQTAGSAIGCEIKVFDVSDATNPTYVSGRDVKGDSTGTGGEIVYGLAVYNDYLYVTQDGDATACSQTAGSAIGCDLKVFDVTDPTNPTYVAGRDQFGAADGTGSGGYRAIAVADNHLFVGTRNGSGSACTDVAGTAYGCELMVYDISTPTTPTYVAGLDSKGASTGNGFEFIYGMSVNGGLLHTVHSGDVTVCSQTAGSANGCEIKAWDITTPGSPSYVAGQDITGSKTGRGSVAAQAVASARNATFVGKGWNATACSQTTGSSTGCELMVFNIGPTASGTLSGTSSFNDINIQNSTTFWSSTTVAGDFQATVPNTDITFFSGATTSLNTVTVTGTNGDEIKLHATASGTASTLDVDGAYSFTYVNVKDSYACSNGTLNAANSTDSGGNTCWSFVTAGTMSSADDYHFYYGQSTTEVGAITLSVNATAANDIRIKIPTGAYMSFDADTTSLTFSGAASGKVSSAVTYEETNKTLVINVTNSFTGNEELIIEGVTFETFNAISDYATYLELHTDGNTSGDPNTTDTKSIWVTGALTLAEHADGQASNKFSFQNKTDTTLYAFKVNPSGEGITVRDLTITLSGIDDITASELTNLKLYKDWNNDGALDGGDAVVDATGILSINGQNGTITFDGDFLTNNAWNWIVTGNTTAIPNGASTVFQLLPSGIVADGATSGQSPYILGNVSKIQHNRNNAGGGGSSSSIGGAPPPGDSVETGGDETGGGELGEEDGANIADNPDFKKPTSTGAPDNEWTNPTNAYNSDGVYATETTNLQKQTYYGFDLSVPGTNTIEGIEVKIDASGSTAAGWLSVSLSGNSGSNWTTAKVTPGLGTSDIVYVVGGPSDTWGREWSPAEFGSSVFRIGISANTSSNTLRLDAIEVRVYHSIGGGSSGGGGAI